MTQPEARDLRTIVVVESITTVSGSRVSTVQIPSITLWIFIGLAVVFAISLERSGK